MLNSPYREHLSQSFARFFMESWTPDPDRPYVSSPVEVA